MKKQIILLLLAIVGSFASCSSDDGTAESNDGALIKSISYTTYNSGIPSTISAEFVYSGNVLQSAVTNDGSIEFEYSGDKVLETRHYEADVLHRVNTYTYDGDNLRFVTSDDGERVQYSYNGNTLTEAQYQLFDEDVWTTHQANAYVFEQGNLIEGIRTNYQFGLSDNRTTYTLDDKHNPTVNMNPYLRLTLSIPGIHLLSANNRATSTNYYPAASTVPSSFSTYEMVYNTNDYPTTITAKNGDVIVSQTVIEYQ